MMQSVATVSAVGDEKILQKQCIQYAKKIYDKLFLIYENTNVPGWLKQPEEIAVRHHNVLGLCSEEYKQFIARNNDVNSLACLPGITIAQIFQFIQEKYGFDMSEDLMFETRQLIHMICYLTLAKQYQADDTKHTKQSEIEHRMIAQPSDEFFSGAYTSNVITKQALGNLKLLKKSLIRLELIQQNWNLVSIEKLLHLHFDEEYKLEINPCVGLNYNILCTLLGKDEASSNHVLHSVLGDYTEHKMIGLKGRPKIPESVKQIISDIQKDKAKRKMNLMYQQMSLLTALKPQDFDTIIQGLELLSEAPTVNQLINQIQSIKQHLGSFMSKK
jgi:hypothetical protein